MLGSCDFINRSAERRNTFALARDLLAHEIQQQVGANLSPDSLRLRNIVAPMDAGVPSSKKKLEFQAGPSSPNVFRVRFGSVDIQSITPRSEKTGAVGLSFELEGNQIVVRSLNPDGPAAADGRIVPGDVLVEGVCSALSYLFEYDCDAVNGFSVNGRSVDSLRKDITGEIGTFVELTVMSCWYIHMWTLSLEVFI